MADPRRWPCALLALLISLLGGWRPVAADDQRQDRGEDDTPILQAAVAAPIPALMVPEPIEGSLLPLLPVVLADGKGIGLELPARNHQGFSRGSTTVLRRGSAGGPRAP